MTVNDWMKSYSDLYDEDASFHVFCGPELTPEEGLDRGDVLKQYGDWQVVDKDVSIRTDGDIYAVPSGAKLADQDDDPVNPPSHYTRGGIECIDAIKASMSPEAFHGFLQGNAMKYIWRHDLKGKPVEDLDKAMWYLTRLRNDIKL